MADWGQNAVQMGDVLLFQGALDAADIEVSGGIITMTQSLETMALLTLFGGSEEDDGSQATERKQWWGNEGEPAENKVRGQLQPLIADGAPITSLKIRDIEAAALSDLEAAFVGNGLATSVSVAVSMSSPKRLDFQIMIVLPDGVEVPVTVSGEIT